MLNAITVCWLSLVCYLLYRGYQFLRYSIPRLLIRSRDEQRLLSGFVIGYCLALLCAMGQLYILQDDTHSKTFVVTLTNVSIILGGGPLLFLTTGLWKEVWKARWLTQVYTTQRSYRVLTRIFFAWIALILSVLLIHALYIAISTFGELGSMNTLTCSIAALICIAISGFFASTYHRRPCRMGMRIQVILDKRPK